MKKPEKYNAGYWKVSKEVYYADEMDAYIAHLEQAVREAAIYFRSLPSYHDWQLIVQWLSRYASEKVEGGGDE